MRFTTPTIAFCLSMSMSVLASSTSMAQLQPDDTSAYYHRGFPAVSTLAKDKEQIDAASASHSQLTRHVQESTASWNPVGQDIDGEAAGDLSGASVAMSADGNRVAIGAPGNDGRGFSSGRVRIYDYSSSTSTWNPVGQDIDGEAARDESGTSVAMSADGNRVAIGASFNAGNGTSNSGHARVYDYDNSTSTWNPVGQDIDGEAANDLSGYSVAMSANGNRVAVGAIGNDGNGTSSSGHVRVYDYNNSTSTWNPVGQDIDGEAANDFSGWSVAMSADGNRVAIGATQIGSFSGRVRVYDYSSSTSRWNPVGQDIDGEAAGDGSGSSVAMSANGNRVAVGAPGNDGRGSNSGRVRIYDYSSSTSTWNPVGQDIDGEAAGDGSGRSVAMSADGNRVAIGAPGNDGRGFSSGHVRVYDYSSSTSTWNPVGQDIDGERFFDQSSFSVAMSADGNRVAIGAPGNDGRGSNSGHVRLYEVSPSAAPSAAPSVVPSAGPSASPSVVPSASPSGAPSADPSAAPSAGPSTNPSTVPSTVPSAMPSTVPSSSPSTKKEAKTEQKEEQKEAKTEQKDVKKDEK
jgi:hypothetical protein